MDAALLDCSGEIEAELEAELEAEIEAEIEAAIWAELNADVQTASPEEVSNVFGRTDAPQFVLV